MQAASGMYRHVYNAFNCSFVSLLLFLYVAQCYKIVLFMSDTYNHQTKRLFLYKTNKVFELDPFSNPLLLFRDIQRQSNILTITILFILCDTILEDDFANFVSYIYPL